MKLILLCVAGAVAVAPPRIELNLPGLTYRKATMTSDKQEGNAVPLDADCVNPSSSINNYAFDKYCSPDNGPTGSNEALEQPDGSKVRFRRDWTQTCPAGSNTTNVNCPVPTAIAWDHNDKEVAVTQHIYLVDYDGQSQLPGGSVSLPIVVNSIDYNYRSTYVLKWDAVDGAGNHAEQVVLQLRLNDVTAPTITWCGEPTTLQAAFVDTSNRFCGSSSASDDIDGSTPVTQTITYSVIQCVNTAGPESSVGGKPPATTKAGGTECGSEGTTLASMASLNIARNAVKLNTPGTYQITVHAHDLAGTYGNGGANNANQIKRLISVVDTLKPTITLSPDSSAVSLECDKTDDVAGSPTTYSDLGFTVYDLLDTAALGKPLGASVNTDLSALRPNIPGSYNVTYDVTDTHLNVAERKYRTINVQDRIAPVISVNTVPGEGLMIHAQHRVVFANRNNGSYAGYLDDGAQATDACDTTVGPNSNNACNTDGSIATCVGPPTWDRNPQCGTGTFGEFDGTHTNGLGCLGTYELTYTVQDTEGLTTTAKRTVTFIDREAPILNLTGPPEYTVEASPEGNYVELGAECHDYVGGDITPARVITAGKFGNVATGPVDYTTTGVYVVDYNCKDASMNSADTIHRTIRVVDTTVPQIMLRCAECGGCDAGVHKSQTVDGYKKGDWTFNQTCTCPDEELEAGFQYVEQGACAIDTLDGITGKYLDEESGNMVDSGDIVITGSVDHLSPTSLTGDGGVYYIKYNTQDLHGSSWDGSQSTGIVPGRNNATEVTRKITVKDTLPPVISLHMKHAGSLASPFHVSRGVQEGLHDVVNPAGSWLTDSSRQAQQTIQDNRGSSGGNPFLRGATEGAVTHPKFNLNSFTIGRMPASIDARTEGGAGADLSKVTALDDGKPAIYNAANGH